MKIKGIALTEKGVVRTAVREMVSTKVLGILEDKLVEDGFEMFPDRKAVALPVEDSDGNVVYATLTLTVGTKAPDEKAVKKSTHKKVEKEVFSIED